ncbi:MAG TPA: energy transducer TonB [Planktothrix sp.]
MTDSAPCDDAAYVMLLNDAKDLLVQWVAEPTHRFGSYLDSYVFVKADVRVSPSLSGSADADWCAGFQQRLQRSWDELATAVTSTRLSSKKKHEPVIGFTLHPNGELTKLHLSRSTGNAILNQSAIKAITNLAPSPTPFSGPIAMRAAFKIVGGVGPKCPNPIGETSEDILPPPQD